MLQAAPPSQHAYAAPTSYQPSWTEQSVQLLQPQLVAVPAHDDSKVHAPAAHASLVQALPSVHAEQPVRTTRESDTVETHPVPLQV